MKRMNILLSPKTILQSLASLLLFPIFMNLVLYFIAAFFGESLQFPDFRVTIVFALLAVFIILMSCRNLPLYLEYDEQTIIAHYPFGITASVWRNKTIYTGKLDMGKSGYYCIYSSEPFPTAPYMSNETLGPDPNYYAAKMRRRSQIVLPPSDYPEAHALFPKTMLLPAEKVDWTTLIDQHKDTKALRADAKRIFILPGFPVLLLKIELGILAAGAFLYCLSDESFALIFVLLLYSAFFWVYGIYRIVDAIRNLHFCGTVSFSDTSVTSSLFKKEQCTVDLTQPVYYAVFRGAEYGSKGKPYIVVSGQWFNYYKVNCPGRSYLSEYPMDTQVAFPYNAETAPYCDFDNWHCVGGFGELNLKRSTNRASKEE